jgi:glyoxylase-like metal-dependent hydrolase (beta-lactamase superfamily II)
MQSASVDQEKAVNNLKKLLDYKFTVILPSHGESVTDNAKEKLRNFIEELN